MGSENVLTKQQRIAKNARIHPDVAFTSVAYHMDLEWLHEGLTEPSSASTRGVAQALAP